MSYTLHLPSPALDSTDQTEQTVDAFVLGAQPDACLLAINPDGGVAVALDAAKLIALPQFHSEPTPAEVQQQQANTGEKKHGCFLRPHFTAPDPGLLPAADGARGAAAVRYTREVLWQRKVVFVFLAGKLHACKVPSV